MFVMLAESGGVHYPQGSELSGEDLAFCCLFVCCMLSGCGEAAETIG